VEDLSCQELVELVTDDLEGSLADPERTRFEGHLAICEGCVTYLEQMRTTIAVTGSLQAGDVGTDAMERLRAAFRSWRR